MKSTRVCLGAALLFGLAAPVAQGRGGVRWMSTDLGPTFSSTFNHNRGLIPKGLAVRVGESGQAAVLYDLDLLRMASGWKGQFVKINGGRGALLGNDNTGEKPLFETTPVPGWAGVRGFQDPRNPKAGPLPRQWAQYKGLYHFGKRVVLSYTVGRTAVLESPWAEGDDATVVFSRTFKIGRGFKPLMLSVCWARNIKRDGAIVWGEGTKGIVAAALVGRTRGTAFVFQNTDLITLRVRSGTFKVLVWAGDKDGLGKFKKLAASSAKPEDLTRMTKGGPRKWTKTLATRGTLGTGEGPYVVDNITPPFDNPWKSILHFGGHDFFRNGDAAICTMEGDVWLVKGIDAGLSRLVWQRIATGLYHALGLKIVDDKIYVTCRDQLVRLHDLNGDNEIDFYECFNDQCHVGPNSHEFATGLETDPQGNFYYCKGTNMGKTIHDSSVIKVSKDGRTFERYATGFRWPNGMGMSPTGVITVADQQGTWVPSSKIDWIEPGGFYGFMLSHHRNRAPKKSDPPLCWIPHRMPNNKPADPSCGGQTWVEGNKWGPLEGQMLHLSYGQCTLWLVLHEKVGNIRQGGTVPFPGIRFDSGGMRARFCKKDGQLYVSGLKGWQTRGPRDGCFQRVRYTGRKVYLPVGMNVTRNGVRLKFAEPLDKRTVEDTGLWDVKRWNYRWTRAYGSPQFSVKNSSKKGQDTMTVKSVKLQADRKTVFVELADMKVVHQMSVEYNIKSASGQSVRGIVYPTVHTLAGR